jgi:hypothetical protein
MDLKDRLCRINAKRDHAHDGGSHLLCLVLATQIVATFMPLKAFHPIWFADQARIGHKTQITRRWAKRGSRRWAPHDQRTASTCIFGAICPNEGNAAGLILPW